MIKSLDEAIKKHGVEGGRLLQFLAPFLERLAQGGDLLKTGEKFNLEKYPARSLPCLINLGSVNNIKGINAFFAAANRKLTEDGLYVGCAEVLEQRMKRIYRKYPPVLNRLYYFFDFIFKRVFPKFKATAWLYYYISGGRNRALSRAEILGRLVYAGFRIEQVGEINDKLYFVAKRVAPPLEERCPSTGIFLKIKRVGKNGRPFFVYKFRTMHPYAQYLQEYVYQTNNLKEGGKFADDFRITKWGRWMRKFWIDEIPMLYNVLRGDLKLVGVRPLSAHYLSLYTNELKLKRLSGKPGLIPPFYADMPKSLDEIMESESRYIEAYQQHPFTTDLQYCYRALNNIFIGKVRSS